MKIRKPEILRILMSETLLGCTIVDRWSERRKIQLKIENLIN